MSALWYGLCQMAHFCKLPLILLAARRFSRRCRYPKARLACELREAVTESSECRRFCDRLGLFSDFLVYQRSSFWLVR